MTWNSLSPSVRSQASKARDGQSSDANADANRGRIQSVAVGLTRPFVFRRRSQTGSVRLRMLYINAVFLCNRRHAPRFEAQGRDSH